MIFRIESLFEGKFSRPRLDNNTIIIVMRNLFLFKLDWSKRSPSILGSPYHRIEAVSVTATNLSNHLFFKTQRNTTTKRSSFVLSHHLFFSSFFIV